MSEGYTTGSWRPNPGSEGAFVEAWKTFVQHVDDFHPTELELVATAEDGSAMSHAAVTAA